MNYYDGILAIDRMWSMLDAIDSSNVEDQPSMYVAAAARGRTGITVRC